MVGQTRHPIFRKLAVGLPQKICCRVTGRVTAVATMLTPNFHRLTSFYQNKTFQYYYNRNHENIFTTLQVDNVR